MKKILSILMVLSVLTVVSFTSCKNNPPSLDYNITATGVVFDSKTNISGDFVINSGNATRAILKATDDVSQNDKLRIEGDFDSYMNKILNDAFSEGTSYDILVKGFIKENTTGIVIPFEKSFTNKVDSIQNSIKEVNDSDSIK